LDKRKKGRTPAPKKKSSAATALERRVERLELDMHDVRSKMKDFGEDLSALRVSVKHIDERGLKGERVLMSVQQENRHTARLVEAIAEKLQVTVAPPVPKEEEEVREHEFDGLTDEELDAPED
jgi:hypothetical protein